MKRILILALVAGMVMLAGCTASGDQAGTPPSDGSYGTAPAQNDGGAGQQQYAGGNGSTRGFGNRTGMMRNGSNIAGRGTGAFGNMTDTQRQQMMQAWQAACDGKSTGDACTAQGTIGIAGAQGEMNGTCSSRGGNLTCMPTGAGRRGGQNGPGQSPQAPQNP